VRALADRDLGSPAAPPRKIGTQGMRAGEQTACFKCGVGVALAAAGGGPHLLGEAVHAGHGRDELTRFDHGRGFQGGAGGGPEQVPVTEPLKAQGTWDGSRFGIAARPYAACGGAEGRGGLGEDGGLWGAHGSGGADCCQRASESRARCVTAAVQLPGSRRARPPGASPAEKRAFCTMHSSPRVCRGERWGGHPQSSAPTNALAACRRAGACTGT
jgi:hypothetical protein